MHFVLAFSLSLNEWAGILPNASEHGYVIDHMLEMCHWFMFVLFVGWTSYFLYCMFRFHRSRNPKASYHGVKSKASAHIEFSVVLVEAVLLLGFGIPLWGKRVNEFPKDSENPLHVHAVGEQFAWNFHYPGPDGKFGRQDVKFISSSNPLGLDPQDPDGKDDIVSKNELHLVKNRPVVIEITSKDVIHSLSLEHMRMDQDAIPGSRIPMWFKPIIAGQYEIVCAQLCGAGHYSMMAQMFVEDDATFKGWIKDELSLQHPELGKPAAPAAAAAPAPATNPAAPATAITPEAPVPAAK
jgi:cytochrome c oxidase subunit II